MRRRLISIVLAGLFVWLAGCYSYTPIEPREVTYHGKVRVWTIDGERETIRDPWVEADSLRSRDAGAIALSQVAGLDAVSTDVEGTVTAVGITVGAVVVLAWLVSCSETDLYC
jgi:hypothetical protein